MKFNYIDIHSHLNLSPLLETKDAILAKMRELGVGTITVGTTLETSKMAVQIAEENENCWATVGLHPCECSIPSPTLPQGKGDAPGYLTGSGTQLESLLIKAKEMRHEPTPAEDKLWQYLKGDKIGYHFRRQHIIDRFIVDFVCLAQELVVEVDGGVHNDLQVRDDERTKILESLGFGVVRFSNDEIIKDIEKVVQKIKEYLERKVLPLGEDLGGDFAELEKLAQHPKTVAIGETGLDYFRDQSETTKQKQIELFKKHIELANKIEKPLMLHVRASNGSDDAYYDALEILTKYSHRSTIVESLPLKEGDAELRANFHFFSGSQKCMEDIVAAGFTISVDGPITFSHDYDEMIKAVPLDKIMIETDAPFAAPAPYRGKPCEPWMVIEIARKIAELKGLDLEVVRVQLLHNTAQFFGLDF